MAVDARAVLAALDGKGDGSACLVAETLRSLSDRGIVPAEEFARAILENWQGRFSRRRMVIAMASAAGTLHSFPPWAAVRPGSNPSIADIVEGIGSDHGASLAELASPSRSPDLARVRFFCEWGCRHGFGYGLQLIGNRLGGRSHTSVLNGVEKAALMLSRTPALRSAILDACDRIDHAAMLRAAALKRPG